MYYTHIFLDETWINEPNATLKTWYELQIKTNAYSVKLPSSRLRFGLETKRGKGRRLMAVHAMMAGGMIDGALWVFQSGKSATVDYHDYMDAYDFEK